MKPITVSQLNEYIASKLKDDINLRGVVLEGEISGLSRGGMHYYLTLKDQDSMIRCAIWASNARAIDMNLIQNGKKIICVGDISPYAKGGNYSFSIRHVEEAKEGDLMAEFNRIKAKLEAEGLFDKKYKKPIPTFPYRIGVITSDTGAAIEDIKKIITSKNNLTNILIFPTLVQGVGACKSIIDNIAKANELNDDGLQIDTLIVGRGGGSAEDLAAFNDEQVARAIFASKIPIISAVGHESDVSISDFVADLRAETPTAAADIAVMNTFELAESISELEDSLHKSILSKLAAEQRTVEGLLNLLQSNMRNKLLEVKMQVERAALLIRENDPLNILNKGYSAVINTDGSIVSSIDSIEVGNDYYVQMRNGKFLAEVKSKEEGDLSIK